MTNHNSTKNIAIIGAGPAGLSTAIALAQKGQLVSIFDKASLPINKVCGEGILPTGVKYLTNIIGVEFISKIESYPFKGIKYIDSNGTIAIGEFNNSKGFGIKRLKLAQALYSLCKTFPNITFYENHKLITLKSSPKQLEFTVENSLDKSTKTFADFNYLIGADGRLSTVRNLISNKGKKPTSLKRKGARLYIATPPWTNMVEVYWANNIEAYVTPNSHKSIGIMFSWDLKNFKANEDTLLSFFPTLKEKIDNKERQGPLMYIGNFAHQSQEASVDNIAFIGDAVVFMDGVTGEGLSLAFEAANLLSESIINDDLISYNIDIKKLKNKYIVITNLALLLTQHKFLRKCIIKLFSLFPTIFRFVLKTNMGNYKA